jgi:hypothetical protein
MKVFIFKSTSKDRMIPLPTSQTSKGPGGALVVTPVNNNTQIQFRNNEYRTTDENLADYIRGRKNFGKDIIEVTPDEKASAKTKETKPAANAPASQMPPFGTQSAPAGDALTVVPEVKSKNEAIKYLAEKKGATAEALAKLKTSKALGKFAVETYKINFVNLK